jgi:hypothetical protein
VVGEDVGLPQAELDQPAPDACLFLPEQGVAAGESRLVPGHGEAQAGFQRGVPGGDVVAPAPVGLFHPERIQGVVAGRAQPVLLAGLGDRVVDVHGQVGRDEQLPAQFADVGDAGGADEAAAEVDFA